MHEILILTAPVSSEGSDESAHMCGLARALAARITQSMDVAEGSDPTLDTSLPFIRGICAHAISPGISCTVPKFSSLTWLSGGLLYLRSRGHRLETH